MVEESWQDLWEIFHQALDKETQERASFLEQVCGGRKDLRARLEELLLVHHRAPSFLAP